MSHQQLGSKFQRAALANTGQVVPVSGQQQQIERDLPRENPTAEVPEETNQEVEGQAEEISDESVSGKAEETVVVHEEKIIEPKKEEIVSSEIIEETTAEDGNVVSSSDEAIDKFTAFRGPGGNGITSQKNIPTQWNGATGENILWKTKIPLSGFNSPIIWNDKLFLTGADKSKQEVYCIDRNTGEFLWTAELKDVPGSPVDRSRC